jgi:hypothetical protein
MHKKIYIFGLLLALALITTGVALADTTSVTLNVSAGGGLAFSTAPSGSETFSATLTGAPVYSDEQTDAWQVRDDRGTGVGWDIDVNSTDLTSASDTIVAANVEFKITSIAKADSTSSNPPAANASFDNTYGALATTDQQVLAVGSAGDGMGKFDIDVSYRISVPADAYAEAYSGTITITLATLAL